MVTPASQKADQRPIAFYLDDAVAGTSIHVPLVIRPEELTRNETSLLSPVQTMEGAFIDDFGPGLSTIQLAGHTGWTVAKGWEQNWIDLRDVVWVRWHEGRAEAVKKGRHPDEVKLIFADALDDIVCVVAPGNLTLKRSKSRPLLISYQTQLTVVSESLSKELLDKLKLAPDGTSLVDGAPGGLASAVSSLQASLDRINAAAASVRGYIDSTVAQPIKNYLSMASTAIGKVISVVNTGRSIITAQAQQFIGIAADIAQAGRNLFYAYNAVVGLPDALRFEVMQVAGAFQNAYCILRNAFQKVQTYPEYSGVYGASSCSSTSGGRPLSPYLGVNTFEAILPSPTLPPAISPEARTSINRLKGMDPALAPMPVSQLATEAGAVAEGVIY